MSTQAIPLEYNLPELEALQGPLEGRFRYWMSMILLVCFYYTLPVIKTPFGYSSYIRLDDIANFCLLLISISAITQRRKLCETPIASIIIIALLFALPSACWGYLLGSKLKNLQLGLLQTVKYTLTFALFMSVMVIPTDEKRFRRLMLIIWLGSIFVGIYGALQYYGFISAQKLAEEFAESGPWQAENLWTYKRQALGPLSHNHACIGAYMVIAIFVALFLSRTAWSVTKIFYLASVPFFMIIILWSQSRADFFGVFVGLVSYMIFSKVRPAAIAGFAGVAIATYIIFNIVPELKDRFMGTEGETIAEFSSGRLTGWFKAIIIMFKRPYLFFTGVGLGNFDIFKEYTGLMGGHNNFIHWLFECGIFGFILPIVVLIKIIKIVKRLSFYGKFRREVSVCFLSLLFSLIAIATTQEPFTPNPSSASVPSYIAFIFGYIIALYRTTLINQQFQEFPYDEMYAEDQYISHL